MKWFYMSKRTIQIENVRFWIYYLSQKHIYVLNLIITQLFFLKRIKVILKKDEKERERKWQIFRGNTQWCLNSHFQFVKVGV